MLQTTYLVAQQIMTLLEYIRYYYGSHFNYQMKNYIYDYKNS